MQYDKVDATLYSQLGIVGTTYESGLKFLVDVIKNARGICIDIGCGTGRVTNLIRNSARNLDMILGMDIASNMIEHAYQNNEDPSVKFCLIDSEFPVGDSSIDLAVSAHVLEEISSVESIRKLFSEVFRTLKPSGQFVILTANPEAIRNSSQFKTYSYDTSRDYLRDGDIVTCTIAGSNQITIDDTFWSHAFIKRMLIEAGFHINNICSPQPDFEQADNWKDELLIAPDNVWVCYKPIS